MAWTAEQKEKAKCELREHVQGMYKDRAVYRRMQMLSIDSTKFIGGAGASVGHMSVLCLTIDGMDQARHG